MNGVGPLLKLLTTLLILPLVGILINKWLGIHFLMVVAFIIYFGLSILIILRNIPDNVDYHSNETLLYNFKFTKNLLYFPFIVLCSFIFYLLKISYVFNFIYTGVILGATSIHALFLYQKLKKSCC